MAIQTVKYFSGTREVSDPHQVRDAEFNKRFGFVLLGKRCDSFTKWAGHAGPAILPVTRIIEFKKNPSLRK